MASEMKLSSNKCLIWFCIVQQSLLSAKAVDIRIKNVHKICQELTAVYLLYDVYCTKYKLLGYFQHSVESKTGLTQKKAFI